MGALDATSAGQIIRTLDSSKGLVAHDTFIVYPYPDHILRSWTLQREDDGRSITHNHDLWKAIAEALDIDKVKILTADEDVRAAEREQWDDGTNFIAVSPGVVIGWDRNVTTNGCSTATASKSSPSAAASSAADKVARAA